MPLEICDYPENNVSDSHIQKKSLSYPSEGFYFSSRIHKEVKILSTI